MENSIEKDFLHYQESLELKEIGFDEPCVMYFWDKNYKNSYNLEPNERPHWSPLNIQNHNQLKTRVSRPTFSQSFRFFREKYTLYSIISTVMHTYPNLEFYFKIQGLNNGKIIDKFNSYEEAELACLRELIKIVKDGK